MSTIEAVFEGGVFRPTTPVSLPEGSRVTVVVDASGSTDAAPTPGPDPADPPQARRPPMFGALKGKIWISPDFDEPLEEFKDYM